MGEETRVMVATLLQDGKPFLRPTFIQGLTEQRLDILPITPETSLSYTLELLRFCQGVLLIGGSDINPHYWGEHPLKTTQPSDDARDCFEYGLVQAILERNIPLLAFCRGEQMLAVAKGATLYQHIPDLPFAQSEMHANPQNSSYAELYNPKYHHAIYATSPHSIIQTIHHRYCVRDIPSMHHQSVNPYSTQGTGIHIEAISTHGIVEVISCNNGRQLGYQGHPEAHPKLSTAVFSYFAALMRETAKEHQENS